MVTPTSSFINLMRTISSITEKKVAEIYGYFLANEIIATERDITGPTKQVQTMFPLKNNIVQDI